MSEFEVIIDLVTYDKYLDVVPDYGNKEVSHNLTRSNPKWDVTLSNIVEAETAEDAAATITKELRQTFSVVDPDWHGLIFEDDNEVLELGGE